MNIVKIDRCRAKKAPSFILSINRFRPRAFENFNTLYKSSRSSSMERELAEVDSDAHVVVEETAFERMVREDYENELKECEF